MHASRPAPGAAPATSAASVGRDKASLGDGASPGRPAARAAAAPRERRKDSVIYWNSSTATGRLLGCSVAAAATATAAEASAENILRCRRSQVAPEAGGALPVGAK